MRCKEDVINSLEICLYPPSKCENCSYYEDEECNDDLCRDALELLKKQPEIVHCKDCEYWVPGVITDQDDFIPPKCGKYSQMVGHSADDFCSLGKKEVKQDG